MSKSDFEQRLQRLQGLDTKPALDEAKMNIGLETRQPSKKKPSSGGGRPLFTILLFCSLISLAWYFTPQLRALASDFGLVAEEEGVKVAKVRSGGFSASTLQKGYSTAGGAKTVKANDPDEKGALDRMRDRFAALLGIQVPSSSDLPEAPEGWFRITQADVVSEKGVSAIKEEYSTVEGAVEWDKVWALTGFEKGMADSRVNSKNQFGHYFRANGNGLTILMATNGSYKKDDPAVDADPWKIVLYQDKPFHPKMENLSELQETPFGGIKFFHRYDPEHFIERELVLNEPSRPQVFNLEAAVSRTHRIVIFGIGTTADVEELANSIDVISFIGRTGTVVDRTIRKKKDIGELTPGEIILKSLDGSLTNDVSEQLQALELDNFDFDATKKENPYSNGSYD